MCFNFMVFSGETIRLLFSMAEVPFQDIRLSDEEAMHKTEAEEPGKIIHIQCTIVHIRYNSIKSSKGKLTLLILYL